MEKKKQSESSITAHIKTVVMKYRHEGLWAHKISDRFTSGIPDWLFCFNGKFVAVEVKAEKKKPRKLQGFVLEQIRQAGGIAICVNSKECFNDFFHKMLSGK